MVHLYISPIGQLSYLGELLVLGNMNEMVSSILGTKCTPTIIDKTVPLKF